MLSATEQNQTYKHSLSFRRQNTIQLHTLSLAVSVQNSDSNTY